MSKSKLFLISSPILLICLLFMAGCTDPTAEPVAPAPKTSVELGNAQYPIKEGDDSLEKVKALFTPPSPAVLPVRENLPPPQTAPVNQGNPNDYPKKPADTNNVIVKLTTAKGDIMLSLDPTTSPQSVANFLEKIKAGFYQNLTFHRVEDWVIQGGDPTGTGTGGATLPTEISNQAFKVGSVGLARGSNLKISNDSQFFICTADCSFLTSLYTYLGEVTQGLDIAQSIAVGDIIQSLSLEPQP